MTGTSDRIATAARGRYVIHFAGVEVGDERWSVEHAGDDRGAVAMGEQVLESPHPLPGRLEWRATLSPLGRVTGVELRWHVGERTVHAEHAAEGDLWRARIDYAGHRREQEGDYPSFCEVLLGTPLFQTFAMRHYVLEPGAEHVFPALVIGPPWMAVEPGKQRVICTARAERETPMGRLAARRIELHDAANESPPYAMWIDEHDTVLEAFEDLTDESPWMRLVEYTRP